MRLRLFISIDNTSTHYNKQNRHYINLWRFCLEVNISNYCNLPSVVEIVRSLIFLQFGRMVFPVLPTAFAVLLIIAPLYRPVL